MIHPDFRTAFEIGLGSFPWARVMHPLIFVVIGVLLVRFLKKRLYLIVGSLIASLAAVFLLVSSVNFIPSFIRARSAYSRGKTEIVEGVVENFRPAPTNGPASESFSVRGTSFHTMLWRLHHVFTTLLSMAARFATGLPFGFTITSDVFSASISSKS